MNALQPSPEWEVLLEPFQSLFTKAGFRYFRVFVFVFAHLDGRLWVTKVILSNLLGRHFTNFYRFLQSKTWNPQEVAQKLWTMCQPCVLDPNKRLFIAIDDTVAQKSGKHFDALGVHHDPMNKQHPRQLSRGHCFVCLAALAQQGYGHCVALFLSCALYVQKKACQEGRTFATKLVLAADLLKALPIPPQTQVIAVCDGAYAKKNFVAPVTQSGRQVISRLRSDTPFYDLPPARKKLPNGKYPPGRPKTYGKKYKAQMWAARMGAWREVTLPLYGRPVTLQIKTRVVLQRTLGVKMRLVAVQWEEGPVVFFFSTDTTLTAAAIVEAVGARFAIETGFRDAKQSFGFSTYQVRREERFVRLVLLCLWAQTLLRLSCWHAKPEPIYGAWRKMLAYLTLSQQKQVSRSQCGVSAGSAEAPTTPRNVAGQSAVA
jgi:hypothetical protein